MGILSFVEMEHAVDAEAPAGREVPAPEHADDTDTSEVKATPSRKPAKAAETDRA